MTNLHDLQKEAEMTVGAWKIQTDLFKPETFNETVHPYISSLIERAYALGVEDCKKCIPETPLFIRRTYLSDEQNALLKERTEGHAWCAERTITALSRLTEKKEEASGV